MNPREARIALINDDKLIQMVVPGSIKKIEAECVAQARTPEEATHLVDTLGAIGANVVFMDTHLTVVGGEGYDLTSRILSEHPDVHVVSISTDPELSETVGIPHLKEYGLNQDELLAVINQL